MIGLVFGIVLPVIGLWVTKSALSAATETSDDPQP